MAESYSERIKALRAEKRRVIRENNKQIANLKALEKSAGGEDTWRKIEEIKSAVSSLLKEKGLDNTFNLKKLSSIPDFYTYQHPERPRLKASDKTTQWVQEFINSGGHIAQLVEKANTTRLDVWMKATSAKKRKKKEEEGDAGNAVALSSSQSKQKGAASKRDAPQRRIK